MRSKSATSSPKLHGIVYVRLLHHDFVSYIAFVWGQAPACEVFKRKESVVVPRVLWYDAKGKVRQASARDDAKEHTHPHTLVEGVVIASSDS